MLPRIIALQFDGVEVQAGASATTANSALDNGNSHIYGTSLFVNYIQGRNVGSSDKHTDDKIVIGYTHQGLPFHIVVNGFLSDKKITFPFIDDYVTPLMAEYAQNLSASQNANETIKKLIHQIYQLRRQYAQSADFTLSLAIVYEKK